jgi:hypothetical protein
LYAWRSEKFIKELIGNSEGMIRDYMKNLGLNGKIILKQSLCGDRGIRIVPR